MKIIVSTLLLLIYANQISAQEAGSKARLAFEHWWCMNLIEAMSESEASKLDGRFAKHFEFGMQYANQMMDELNTHGDKNNENWRGNAPMFWRWSLRGPTEDFIIGRLFEATKNHANDEFYYNEKKEFLDDELRYIEVSNEYRNRNCKILN